MSEPTATPKFGEQHKPVEAPAPSKPGLTPEQLEEAKKNLAGNQKIMEVSPGVNKVLTRIRG